MSCPSTNTREEHKHCAEALAETNECRSLRRPQDMPVEEVKPEYADTLDLLLDFVSSLMERDYAKSVQLCKQVIDREPWNKLALEFLPLLVKKYTADNNKRNQKSRSSDSSSGGSNISGGSSRCGSTSSLSSDSNDSSSNCSSSSSNEGGKTDSDDSKDSDGETESDNDTVDISRNFSGQFQINSES